LSKILLFISDSLLVCLFFYIFYYSWSKFSSNIF